MLDPHATVPDLQAQRRQLRRVLRQRRRNLDPARQRQAARAVASHLQRQPELIRARRVAAYLACDGELDPAPLLTRIAARGCRIYFPVIADDSPLGVRFLPAPSGRGGWRRNRFGIREPAAGRALPAWQLDVLLMPLVGFDRDGHRLGMGGGYYDRLLADLARRVRRPRCIGLAHGCQQVESLPVADWDRNVEAIVTERGVIRTA